jgi:hypothetical protein
MPSSAGVYHWYVTHQVGLEEDADYLAGPLSLQGRNTDLFVASLLAGGILLRGLLALVSLYYSAAPLDDQSDGCIVSLVRFRGKKCLAHTPLYY